MFYLIRRRWELVSDSYTLFLLEREYRRIRDLQIYFEHDPGARERLHKAMSEIDVLIAQYEAKTQEADGDA